MKKHDGFTWLTHFVNYYDFPHSLSIVCVFNTNEDLSKADVEGLHTIINDELISHDIRIKDIRRHICFDTEENCERVNNGKWHERFRQ